MVKGRKMIKKRWKVYEFSHETPKEIINEVKPCGVCFSKLITDLEYLFAQHTVECEIFLLSLLEVLYVVASKCIECCLCDNWYFHQ